MPEVQRQKNNLRLQLVHAKRPAQADYEVMEAMVYTGVGAAPVVLSVPDFPGPCKSGKERLKVSCNLDFW